MTPTVNTGLIRNLSPQCGVLLNHLKRAGSITGVEAAAVYRMRALPRRIADLKSAGVSIRKVQTKDLTGQRYVRYFLAAGTPSA